MFTSNQVPGITLGVLGYDESGWAAFTFMPQGVFSDATRLFVSETRNNHVLIWRSIPTSNGVSADLVLGQKQEEYGSYSYSFETSLPREMDNPIGLCFVGVEIDTGETIYVLFVADMANDRVLAWFNPATDPLPDSMSIGTSQL